MPQNPISDLVVMEGGTIVRQVDTLIFEGAGVSLTQSAKNPRNVTASIPGGGTPTLAPGALFGNPGTVAGAGTNVTVGAGLTMTAGGSLEATGGGGGSYVGGLGIDIVTNAGTGTINNTGGIILPTVDAATATASPPGIFLFGGAITNVSTATPSYDTGGSFYNKGGDATGSGNPTGGYVELHGGKGLLTGPGTAVSGHAYIDATAAYVQAGPNNFANASGAQLYAGGGTVTYGGVIIGGPANINGGPAIGVAAGNTVNGGGVTLSPGDALGSGTKTPGSLYFNLPEVGSPWIVKNIATADPSVLGAIFEKSLASVGYVLVRSQG